MAKKQTTGKITGRVISCRYDNRNQCFRIRVIVGGEKIIRVGQSPHRQRVGDVVVVAGDDLGECVGG